MNIIKICGGLGNQLFQYGLYEKYMSIGKEVYVFMDKDYYSNVYQLPLLSLQPAKYPKTDELQEYLASTNFFTRIKRKFNKKFFYREPENGKFNSTIFSIDNKFISGYFQSEKYFEDIGDVIRKKVRFQGSEGKEITEIVNKLGSENSVAVHVRLTDYLLIDDFNKICGLQYYYAAFEYIYKNIKKPVFYLFSDDLPLARKILKKFEYKSINLSRPNYLDMYLMSKCRHSIIANSSFSWWGAWLKSNNDKIIIAPQRWSWSRDFPDICPKDWIRI